MFNSKRLLVNDDENKFEFSSVLPITSYLRFVPRVF